MNKLRRQAYRKKTTMNIIYTSSSHFVHVTVQQFLSETKQLLEPWALSTSWYHWYMYSERLVACFLISVLSLSTAPRYLSFGIHWWHLQWTNASYYLRVVENCPSGWQGQYKILWTDKLLKHGFRMRKWWPLKQHGHVSGWSKQKVLYPVRKDRS